MENPYVFTYDQVRFQFNTRVLGNVLGYNPLSWINVILLSLLIRNHASRSTSVSKSTPEYSWNQYKLDGWVPWRRNVNDKSCASFHHCLSAQALLSHSSQEAVLSNRLPTPLNSPYPVLPTQGFFSSWHQLLVHMWSLGRDFLYLLIKKGR